jgi:hypothetical protein
VADSASTHAELAIEGDLAQLISLKKAFKKIKKKEPKGKKNPIFFKNQKIEKEKKNRNKHLKSAQTFYISS